MNEHLKAVLADLKAQQNAGTRMLCPRCGSVPLEETLAHNALSRHAYGVYVCSNCGMAEALEDYFGVPNAILSWEVFKRGVADLKACAGDASIEECP